MVVKRIYPLFLAAAAIAAAKPAAVVKYLPPAAFPELPDKVVSQLQGRKCMIPQFPKGWTISDRINVTRGEFQKAGQKDWAVVCATATEVTLLIYWNASEKDPAELPVGDRNTYWFTGLIPQELLKRKYADKLPDVKLDHDGIGITNATEQTTIQFFQDGKWSSFRGVPIDTSR